LLAWEKQLIAARLAKHYKKLKKETRDSQHALAAKFYKRLVHDLKEHEAPASLFSLLLKKISPRFNGIRLLLARTGKIFSIINGSLPEPIKWIFTIAGLYFLIELAFHVAVIIKEGPQAFWEDNRPSSMANAVVMFSINFTGLMLTLLLAPAAPLVAGLWIGILSLAGFVFDVGAEGAIGIYSYKNQQGTLDKIDAELAQLKAVDVNHQFKPKEILLNPERVELVKQQIDKKSALLEMRHQLLEKRKELYINRAYTLAIMLILCACAVFIFFPFASLPLAPLIASGVALGVGSIFGGIGKHLFWNTIMDAAFCGRCAEKLSQAGRWLKECFGSKVKAPFKDRKDRQTCSDDWEISYHNTKDIQQSLLVAEEDQEIIIMDAADQDKKITPRKEAANPAKSKYEFPLNHLHRSPSGILMVDRETDIRPSTSPLPL
jgi:hypothetical protein